MQLESALANLKRADEILPTDPYILQRRSLNRLRALIFKIQQQWKYGFLQFKIVI